MKKLILVIASIIFLFVMTFAIAQITSNSLHEKIQTINETEFTATAYTYENAGKLTITDTAATFIVNLEKLDITEDRGDGTKFYESIDGLTEYETYNSKITAVTIFKSLEDENPKTLFIKSVNN